jgi:hypothetical protein
MNSRFRKLGIESLEGHSVLSTMAEADFNGGSGKLRSGGFRPYSTP